VHRDRHVEGDALLRILDRELVGGLGHADGADGGAGPREVERLHRQLEAVAFRAEPIDRRHDDVLQREGRGVRRALPHLVEVLLDRHAGRVHRDDERRDAAVPLGDVGLREDDRPLGVARVRDEGLRAVQDVLVAAALGARLQPGDVGACVGLGEPERAEDRALDQRRQPLGLLLVGAGDQHRAGAQAVRADRGADTGATPVQLLADEHPVERAEPEAAVLGGYVQVHQPERVRLLDHVGRVAHLDVVQRRLGADLLGRELARQRAQLPLFVRQRERDAADSLLHRCHSELLTS